MNRRSTKDRALAATPKRNIPLDRTAEKGQRGEHRPNMFRGGTLFAGEGKRDIRFDLSSFYAVLKTNSDVADCVRELSENTGAGGYEWVNAEDESKPLPNELVKKLDSILSYDSSFRLLKTNTIRDDRITGNAYWSLITNITRTDVLGIQRIDPRTLVIIADVHGIPRAYIQRVTGQEPVLFTPEEIVHFRADSDSDNEIFGQSPLEPILYAVWTDLSAEKSNYHFFKNDATPATLYILNEELSGDEADAALEFIRKQLGGPENRGKPATLQGVKEVKTISMTNRDMEYLGGRRFTTEKICARFGVPKFVLGYTDTVNNNNGTELQKKFYNGTISPLEERIAETINRELIQRIGLSGKVKFRFRPQMFDETAQLEARGQAEVDRGILTRRQYKQKTAQAITPEDESNPMFDKHIVINGTSAVLLEEVGLPDPTAPDFTNPAAATNALRLVEALSEKVKATEELATRALTAANDAADQ